jgi:hypothetical protein
MDVSISKTTLTKQQVFFCAMCIGVWMLRRRRKLAGIGPSRFQAPNVVVSLKLLVGVLLLVLPWYRTTSLMCVTRTSSVFPFVGFLRNLAIAMYLSGMQREHLARSAQPYCSKFILLSSYCAVGLGILLVSTRYPTFFSTWVQVFAVAMWALLLALDRRPPETWRV